MSLMDGTPQRFAWYWMVNTITFFAAHHLISVEALTEEFIYYYYSVFINQSESVNFYRRKNLIKIEMLRVSTHVK